MEYQKKNSLYFITIPILFQGTKFKTFRKITMSKFNFSSIKTWISCIIIFIVIIALYLLIVAHKTPSTDDAVVHINTASISSQIALQAMIMILLVSFDTLGSTQNLDLGIHRFIDMMQGGFIGYLATIFIFPSHPIIKQK